MIVFCLGYKIVSFSRDGSLVAVYLTESEKIILAQEDV
jgi:hypothetical protein